MEFLSLVWGKLMNVTATFILALGLFTNPVTDGLGSTILSDIKSSLEKATTAEPLSEGSLTYPYPSEKILSSRETKLLSPDEEVAAVTYSSEEETVTFLVDSEDNQVSKVYWGSAVGWSPDQSRVYVFLPDRFSKDGKRHMYYLNRDGSVSDPELPEDVYTMSISPDGQNIAYVKARVSGTDAADIYIRDAEGGDTVLVKGQDNIFSKLSWSLDSKTLFYEKSDLLFRPGMQSNWSMHISGAEDPHHLGPVSD